MYGKAIVCCLALWSTEVLAQDKVGLYLGGTVGQFDFQEEGDGAFADDDLASSYKIYGGYRFTDTWAVEGSYLQTDELTRSAAATFPPFATLSGTVPADHNFLGARGVAHVKAFFAGIGYWKADWDATLCCNPLPPRSIPVSDTDTGVSIVLGGQWDLERVGIRVELEAYDMDDTESVYNYGVGVHYRF